MKLSLSTVGKIGEKSAFSQRNLLRLGICWLVVILGYSLIVGRLFYEQIISTSNYQESVLEQTVRRIRIPANRGRIFSSNGTLIADTLPAYNAVLHLSSMLRRQRSKTVDNILLNANRIALATGRTLTITKEDVIRHMNTKPGLPLTIFSGLSQAELAMLLEMPEPVPGLEITADPIRHYPLGRAACHLVGWVGKDDPMRAVDRKQFTYYQPDMIGRFGLEDAFDSEIAVDGTPVRGLRGSAGEKLLLVNHRGYAVRELESSEGFENGNDVRLTLDIHAQTLAERLMYMYCGAFVLLDVATGDVISLVSSPGYDLQECIPYLPSATYKKWNEDSEKPLIDRSCCIMEMPGSVIKPIVALAIMKKYPASTTVTCTGKSDIGIRCTGVHGAMDLANAIRVSCNTYFVERGIGTGLDQIQHTFKTAGIGTRPLDFPLRAARGSLPSRELKERIDKTPWNAFDTGLISIGQGKVALSPLQIALYMSAIANNGVAYVPNLVQSVTDPAGRLLASHTRLKPALKLDGTPYEFSEIQRGMKMVAERGGTGVRAKNSKTVIYGKSGTAELGSARFDNMRKNTWFAGYAKHQNGKTYAFCMFIENGQAGGYTNAPIVSEFFENWVPESPPVRPIERGGTLTL